MSLSISRNIISALTNIFDDSNRYFIDEYSRKKSNIIIYQNEKRHNIFSPDFHDFLIYELTTNLDGLTIVSDNCFIDEWSMNDMVRLNYQNCEVIMDYSINKNGDGIITFTKLSYAGDIRGFEDYF